MKPGVSAWAALALALLGCVATPPPIVVTAPHTDWPTGAEVDDEPLIAEPTPPPVPELPPKPEPEPYTYVQPLPNAHVMSDFWACRSPRRGRRHDALDLSIAGEDGGLGTAVGAIATSRVTLIGTPEVDSRSFGRPLRSRGTARRGHGRYPASADIEPYGRVYFFTRSQGSWRSGTIVETEVLEGPLTGFRVRYMHLAAVHPNLHVGDVLKPGAELGLLGGTAVQDASPHLHVDAEDPGGRRIDLGPVLGLTSRLKSEIEPCSRRRS